VADLRHFTAHLWNTSFVAGRILQRAHLITRTANAVVVVEREVGTLSAPETPGVDSSTVFTQWQGAVVDVSASFGVEASSEGICN
jgi:hypothetical protein